MRAQFLVAGLMLAAAGCGGDSVEEERIQVKSAQDPLHEPKSILKQYAEGQAMGSEASTFPELVERVREESPHKADILEQGFAELKAASPAERKKKAVELLEKLEEPSP